MAVLAELKRIEVWAELMRKYSADGQTIGIVKSDLQAAVNALDDFFNTNATAINNALPTAAKNSLTTAQKAVLLMYVIQKRYLEGA